MKEAVQPAEKMPTQGHNTYIDMRNSHLRLTIRVCRSTDLQILQPADAVELISMRPSPYAAVWVRGLVSVSGGNRYDIVHLCTSDSRISSHDRTRPPSRPHQKPPSTPAERHDQASVVRVSSCVCGHRDFVQSTESMIPHNSPI